jgi:LmbE family N-acetylglucosaminyl deacetylase
MEQVKFYVTAHQDDHELFMAGNVERDLSSPRSKVVFVYTTAGDADETDGWWQAREAATLAGTQEWVKLYGLFHPVRITETVMVGGRQLAKVMIGNAVHYFLRLTETGFENLVDGIMATSVGEPRETYKNVAAVEAVLQAIFKVEATQISMAGVHTSAFQNTWGDHSLHMLTGEMVANAIATDKTLSTCMSETYYFGYQHWLDTVNMVEPQLGFQRQLWLTLSYTASLLYSKFFIWPLHIEHLGRQYIGRVKRALTPCTFV